MKLSELYSRNVEETLNPVVATGDLNAQTISTEINEYVFTVDIVNGLYRTLEAIKNGFPELKSGTVAVLDQISQNCLLNIGLLDQTMKGN